jgi:glycosyltransferase involved in cell wall biosynthesis
VNIGHFVFHSCSRVHKLAAVQAGSGDKCYLVNCTFAEGHPWHVYELIARIFKIMGEDGEETVSGEHIRNVIKELDDKVDVWHCHNQPDWLVPLVKQATQKPVIYDVHDLTSKWNPERPKEMEEESFKLSDGVMTCSPGLLKVIREKIGPEKPSMFYYSYMPKVWNREPAKNPYFDLVYAGGLGHKSHLDWRSTFKWIVDQGIRLKVMPTTYKSADEYRAFGVGKQSILDPQPYDGMLNIIKNASIGLLGSPVIDLSVDTCVPNKLFEYLSCGIPVIVMNMPEAEEIVKENGLGVCIKEKWELPTAINRIQKNLDEYRERVQIFSKDYCMEGQLKSIKLFYQLLIHRNENHSEI